MPNQTRQIHFLVEVLNVLQVLRLNDQAVQELQLRLGPQELVRAKEMQLRHKELNTAQQRVSLRLTL